MPSRVMKFAGPKWEQTKRKAQSIANAYQEPVRIVWDGEGFKLTLQHEDRPAGLFIETVKPVGKGGGNV